MAGETVGSEARPLRAAVVGAGPAGFYTAQALLGATGIAAEVDLFDRLPTPYGLVRGGVAPDHQRIKSVIRIYEKIAATPGFRFFGNVQLGRDVSLEELLACYDQVALTTGAESDRKMGIPGEELEGVYSATELVGWFNGHPDFQDRTFPLAGAKRAALVGNGNVAIDVARVLSRSPDELASTDITSGAVAALRESTLEEIYLLGRRGPAQAAFSPKEIRELASLEGVDLVVPEDQATLDPVSKAWLEDSGDRDAKKNTTFLIEQATLGEGTAPRKIRCLFLVSPVEIIGEDGRVTGVVLERNALVPDDRGTPRPRGTGETWTLPVDLVFAAIGYRGRPIPGVPFHDRWGIIPNDAGRVTGDDGAHVPGLYVAGWAKRGPTGLIGTNASDAQATVDVMLADRGLHEAHEPVAALEARLAERGVDVVTFADWGHLDRAEVAAGEEAGKLREKVTSVSEMLSVIAAARSRG